MLSLKTLKPSRDLAPEIKLLKVLEDLADIGNYHEIKVSRLETAISVTRPTLKAYFVSFQRSNLLKYRFTSQPGGGSILISLNPAYFHLERSETELIMLNGLYNNFISQ